jgi:hypothetical protein
LIVRSETPATCAHQLSVRFSNRALNARLGEHRVPRWRLADFHALAHGEVFAPQGFNNR